MSLRDVTKQLEKGWMECLDRVEPEPPQVLQDYKSMAGFVRGLQIALDREDDLLRCISVYFATTNQIRYTLNDLQWWLLRGRIQAAYLLCQTIDSLGFGDTPLILDSEHDDRVVISWLLINYWDEHAELPWKKDSLLWFYQNSQ